MNSQGLDAFAEGDKRRSIAKDRFIIKTQEHQIQLSGFSR